MFKKFLICIVCSLISVICVYAQETLTITTYYPSPYGSYNQLQTNMLGVGDNDNDGSLDSGDVPPITNPGDVWIRGNVGIGTVSPGAKLEVAGQVKITGGSPASGKVLTSNASGLATWQTPTVTLGQNNCYCLITRDFMGTITCVVGYYQAGVCGNGANGRHNGIWCCQP